MKHPSDWTDTQRKRFLILGGLLLVAALLLVGWLVGEPMLRLASDPEAFRQWIAERKTSGLLLYGGMVCFQVFFAIIPGEPLEIAGGYAFGAALGHHRLSGRRHYRKFIGVPFGAAVRAASGGGVFPKRKTAFYPFFAKFPPAHLSLSGCLYDPRYAQGPIVLFCRAHRYEVSRVPSHLLSGPSALAGHLHHWGDALGIQSYLFASHRLCGYLADQWSRTSLLPLDLQTPQQRASPTQTVRLR